MAACSMQPQQACENDDDVWNMFSVMHHNDDELQAIIASDAAGAAAVCEHKDVNLEDGNYVCVHCNIIMGRFLDTSAEWRYFGGEDLKGNPTRCGMPVNDLFPHVSGSVIGYGNNESYDVKKMRRYHMWNSMTYRERSLCSIFDILSVNAANNGIPKIILEEAKQLYKKVSEMKISRGDNRSGLIASSIYMACKNHKVPRSTNEIAKIFNLKGTTMTKGCKKFQELLKTNMMSSSAENFINRFCSRLNFNNIQRDICAKTVKKTEDMCLVCENTPPSLAAGVMYTCNVYYKWGVTKKDLAIACDISQVTISKCHKKIMMHVSILFTEDGDAAPEPVVAID